MNQRLKLALSTLAFLPVIFACSQPAPAPPTATPTYRLPPTQIPSNLVVEVPQTLVDGQLRSINRLILQDQVAWVPHSARLLVLDSKGFSLLDSRTLTETSHWPTAVSGLIAISPMTSVIAFADYSESAEQIVVLDVSTQRILRKIKLKPEAAPSQLDLSPDGRWLAINLHVSNHRQLVVFDLSSGKRTRSLDVPITPSPLHFSADSTTMLIAYEGVITETQYVRLQKVSLQNDAVIQRDVTLPNDWLRQFDASPDNQWIILNNVGCNHLAVNFATGQTTRLGLDGSCAMQMASHIFSPNSTQLAIGSTEGKLTLLDAHRLTPLWSVQAYTDGIEKVQFSADGKYIVTVGRLGGVKLWSAQSGQGLRDIDPYAYTVSLSPDGDKLFTIGSGYLKVWNFKTGQLLRARQIVNSLFRNVNYSPNSKRIAYELEDLVLIRDAHTGSLIAQCAFALSKSLLGFSSGGEHFVIYENDNAIVEYNVQSCKPEQHYSIPFTSENQRAKGLGFSAERGIIAITEPGFALSLYNTLSGKKIAHLTQLQRLDGPTSENSDGIFPLIIFSPNGKYVAAMANAGRIFVWEISSGKQLAVIKVENGLLYFEFLGDSRQIVLISVPRQVNYAGRIYLATPLMVWDIKSGTLKSLLDSSNPAAQVHSFAIDNSNNRIVSESADHQLHTWDISTGQLLSTQKIDFDGNIVALRPDGKQLIIQNDNHLQLVDVP